MDNFLVMGCGHAVRNLQQNIETLIGFKIFLVLEIVIDSLAIKILH